MWGGGGNFFRRPSASGPARPWSTSEERAARDDGNRKNACPGRAKPALRAGFVRVRDQTDAQETVTDEAEVFGSDSLAVRIRYRSRPIPCTVARLEDGRLLVRFREEASAIAPGQSAVFYIGRRVVGGAFIASQRGIGMYVSGGE